MDQGIKIPAASNRGILPLEVSKRRLAGTQPLDPVPMLMKSDDFMLCRYSLCRERIIHFS